MTVQVLDTVYGRMLVPDTDDSQYTWLSSTGEAVEHVHVEEIVDLLRERKFGTAVDGGACFGTWSLAMAPVSIEVLAFEPQLEVHDMLRGTIALNRLSRKIKAHRSALWSEPKHFSVAALNVDRENNFGCVSLRPEHYAATASLSSNFDTVYAAPLSYWTTTSRLSFVKLDIEGSEIEALIGARELIERDHPIMFIEWMLSDKQDLTDLIESMGYLIDEKGPNFLCLPLKGSV